MTHLLTLLLTATATAPAQRTCWTPVQTDRVLAARVMKASPISGTPPTLDGRLDDPSWCASDPAGAFVQSGPNPGEAASLPTVVHLLYDDGAVWVGIRAYDTHPDSIVAPYSRRDDETASDWLFVEIDTRFDRRTALSFGLNPRGVQVDGAWNDDIDYGAAWNGVWSGAARIDSLGWTAEFRIPWSQLPLGHSTSGDSLTWGINVYRYTPHRGEISNWSPRLPTQVGVVSHFNRVEGLVAPRHHAGLEVVPFASMSATPRDPSRGSAAVEDVPAGGRAPSTMATRAAFGLDTRLHPTGSTSLAASVLPDFGQVEADPSQVNLTTFETFQEERRPLFVESADVFRFRSTLSFEARGTSFEQEEAFYSRRVGAPPHGGVPDGAVSAEVPRATDVVTALRLSGRLGPWSGGAFDAWTSREHATFTDSAGVARQADVEPLTHFSVARALREFDGASRALGGIVTLVDRLGMTPRLSQSLPRRAVAVGVDGRSRFAKDRYEVTGFALGSHVVGSAEALHALRPRGTAASDHLTGAEAQARLARVEGAFLWSVATRLVTPDFETNDAGFQRNADWALAVGSWRFQDYRPGHAVRRWAVGSTQLGYGRTLGGLTRAATVDLRADADLANYWGGSVEFLRELPSYDPEVLRGGPFLRLPTRDHLEVAAYTDTRKPWQVTANGAYVRERGSSTSGWSLAARASGFLSDRLQVSLAPTFSTAHEGWQFVAATRDAGGRGRWILGNMRQRTASLTTRATWAFSPHLTLQLYADAFVSSGAFGAFSEVPADQVSSTARRVRPIVPDRLRRDGAIWRLDSGERATSFADPAYSERDLNMNLLLRWEFRPGSTLYAVWTQARRDDVARPFDLGTDLARLQNARGRNALELKVSWWLAT